MKSPNVATRYLAWTALQKAGAAAVSVLDSMYASDPNPRFRARALWLLGQMDGKGSEMVQRAVQDKDADIRITGLRLARRLGLELPPSYLRW
ncbi:MAG UNVERIFIED_CONTAM: hypothetical protein LVR18_02840 [Planctomycetaceae bacterium]